MKKPANFPPLPSNPMTRSNSESTNAAAATTITVLANQDTNKRSIADIVRQATVKKPAAEESPKKKAVKDELAPSSPKQQKKKEEQEKKKEEEEDAFPSLCTTSSDEFKSKASTPFSYADMLKKKERVINKEHQKEE